LDFVNKKFRVRKGLWAPRFLEIKRGVDEVMMVVGYFFTAGMFFYCLFRGI